MARKTIRGGQIECSRQSPAPKFGIGEVVQRVNQSEAIGVVRDRRWNSQSEGWDSSSGMTNISSA